MLPGRASQPRMIGGTFGPSTEAALGHWPAALPGHRKILIHAGLHKTGSTALQQLLSSISVQLRGENVLYPSAGRPSEAPGGHHNVAWQLGGDRRFRTNAGTLDDVAAEISAFPGDAILSSEDFESVLGSPERLIPLLSHELLSKHTFTLMFYLRDQASYLESLFFEMLHHGMAVEASRLCEMALKHGQVFYDDWVFYFDYFVLQNSFSGMPINVVMRPYVQAESGGTIADFLAFTGLAAHIPPRSATQRVNVRQTLLEALELFLQVRLGRRLKLPSNMAELLKNRDARLSPQMRFALADRFESGNRDLMRLHGFASKALLIPTAIPSNVVPLDELFSLQTQSTFVSCGAEELAKSLRPLLEVCSHRAARVCRPESAKP